MNTGIIVAGTDTGVGKTVLSALLLNANTEALYWKPIQSGLTEETDTQTVLRLTSLPASRTIPEVYRLSEPLSPHLSAYLDGVTIERERLALPESDNALIVEAAGGVLVPIGPNALEIDLFSMWELPVVIASRSTLGTINHSLLTIEALRRRNIPIVGVVMIGMPNPENEKAVSEYGDVPIVGRIPLMESITSESLRRVWESDFDRKAFELAATSV